MLNRVLLWLSFLFCVISCSNEVQILAAAELKLGAMSTAQNTEERAYVSRMYALFQIVDLDYLKKTLIKAPNYSDFEDCVRRWSRYNSDRWSDIQYCLHYCDSLLKIGEFGTDIDAIDPDVRWQLFVENGIPKNEQTLLGRCSQSDTGCAIWVYIWPSQDSCEQGKEISCWSRFGEDYPNEIIDNGRDYPVASPIWPFVNYSQFPESDGTTDVWFSVWVPGNQFTSLTLDKGQLSIQIELYDSSKTVLLASNNKVSNLQIIRGVLQSVECEDRASIRAIAYFGFPNLEPGRYSARLTILGAQDNEGQNWIEVLIPKDRKVSDLLVLEQSTATGENILPGIVRGDLANLYDNPECRLISKAKFDLYLETTLPKGHGKYYEVWVTMLPIPEVSGRSSTTITTGKPRVVADSLERPFTKGEWQSSRNQKYLEEMAKSESESESKPSKTITLLRKKFDAPEDRVTIQVAPRLKSNLKSGQYLLTVTITDPERQNYFLSARRVIRIAPASEMEF
jgi:hypothetical protein